MGRWKESDVKDTVPAFRETSEKDKQVDTLVQHAQLSEVKKKNSRTLKWLRTDFNCNILLQQGRGSSMNSTLICAEVTGCVTGERGSREWGELELSRVREVGNAKNWSV